MTGGQMAPTSLPGQVTQTSPYGRDVTQCGYPIRVCEMLSQLEGPEYLERVTVNSVKKRSRREKSHRKGVSQPDRRQGIFAHRSAFRLPTNWGMTPQDALKWIDDKMIPYYPLGVFKDRSGKEA
jgi:2-oxoglutarate ferredoxin oxidoreductase subunit beta